MSENLSVARKSTPDRENRPGVSSSSIPPSAGGRLVRRRLVRVDGRPFNDDTEGTSATNDFRCALLDALAAPPRIVAAEGLITGVGLTKKLQKLL